METVSPEPIMASIFGYLRTAAMQAAVRLDLFTAIGEGVTDIEALATRIQSNPRSLRSLCDYLTTLGHLEKHDAAYALSPSSAAFLDRRAPAYLGAAEAFLASPDNQRQALGDPLAFLRHEGGAAAGNLAPDNPVWAIYARAMVALAAPVARATAKILAPTLSDATILDVAAGSGLFGIELLRTLPAARVVALDWPHVLEVAAENAAKRGVDDRLQMKPGSALEVDWGAGYDLVLLPNFLHHFDAATATDILRRARAALLAGGRVAIIEFMPELNRVSAPTIAAFSLLMRVTTPDGDAYTANELAAMARAAGFTQTEATPLGATLQTLLVAS
jgi:2-polyprenyl-3-methyl-5-hydroxy-6-metoxy-1,4-benzoquinol methylase